jgi:putative transposase
LIKYKRKPIKKRKHKSIISLDPGIRTPFTGYSNKEAIKIGTNINKHIKTKLNKMDNILNDDNLKESRKHQLKLKIYEKIKNRITDFHWKTINYLTSNYGSVVIGDLSTKTTGEKKGDKMTKRIGNLLNLYKFKMRLQYKCFNKRVKYVEVNEAYTSKCCSICSYLHKDLGSAKVYKCPSCKNKIDRDINGAINILLKC